MPCAYCDEELVGPIAAQRLRVRYRQEASCTTNLYSTNNEHPLVASAQLLAIENAFTRVRQILSDRLLTRRTLGVAGRRLCYCHTGATLSSGRVVATGCLRGRQCGRRFPGIYRASSHSLDSGLECVRWRMARVKRRSRPRSPEGDAARICEGDERRKAGNAQSHCSGSHCTV